jgi:hypothetical protein
MTPPVEPGARLAASPFVQTAVDALLDEVRDGASRS